MKTLILFSLLFCSFAYTQDSVEYRDYLYSQKVKLKKNESIFKILKQYGYDISNKKWIVLTRDINGLKNHQLRTRVTNRYIYLPPQISFSKYLQLKRKGKLRPSRKIASIKENVKDIQKLPTKPSNNTKISFEYGTLNISSALDKKLSVNVAKFKTKFKSRLSENYSFYTILGATKYSNFIHSDSEDSASSNQTYPEFGLELERKFTALSSKLSYTNLNYFVISDNEDSVELTSSPLHRLQLSLSKTFLENIILFIGAGYISNYQSESRQGQDFSIGTTILMGKEKKLSLSGTAYQNQITSTETETTDSSTALVLSIGFSF